MPLLLGSWRPQWGEVRDERSLDYRHPQVPLHPWETKTGKDGCTCFPEAAQAGTTHLVGVRPIPVGYNFCLPMTHQVHLEREQGQETSSESPCHHWQPLRLAQTQEQASASRNVGIVFCSRELQAQPHLEVIQELGCDGVRCPNHHF